jgi:hypothetical protein
MHRSITKIFSIISLFFTMNVASLNAMSQPIIIDVARLERCFNQLSEPLASFQQDSVVYGSMHSLKLLIAACNEPIVKIPDYCVDNLCTIQKKFSVLAGYQNCFDEKVKNVIAEVVALLTPISLDGQGATKNDQDGSFEDIVKNNASAGWAPMTSSYHGMAAFLKTLSRAKKWQGNSGQKAPGQLTVQTNWSPKLLSCQNWSSLTSPFQVDLSPIARKSSLSEHSSENCTPLELSLQKCELSVNDEHVSTVALTTVMQFSRRQKTERHRDSAARN